MNALTESSPRIRTLLDRAHRAGSEGELLSDLAHAVVSLTEFDACDILVRDMDGLRLKATTAAPEYANRVRLGRGVGLTGLALTSNQHLFIESGAADHASFARYPGIDDVRCESCAVLLIPDHDPGRTWGVCMLKRGQATELDASRRAELEGLANDLGLMICTFYNFYNAGARASRIGALSEVTKTISSSPYIEEILQLLVNLTAQQFNYVVCTVRLLDEAHGELVLRATQAPAKAYARKRAIKPGESIAGKALIENRPIIVPDVQQDESYIGLDLAIEQGLRSMVCVPLTIQGRAIGVMSCYTGEIREFPPDEIKALETLAKQAAVSIEHAKLQVRSTLMQEMHHRVKNNLQQIASLLRLQLRQSKYKSLEQAINDSLSRILAISSVHDLLSREDLDHVGIRSIAEILAHHQINSLIMPNRRIEFMVRGDDVRLNMAQATQVALVLNELISNAVEHGFERTLEGEIHVTVEWREGEIALWVSNNGDPLPDSFSLESASLGLQIVESLARSLGGRFQLSNILGWTVAEVKFMQSGMDV